MYWDARKLMNWCPINNVIHNHLHIILFINTTVSPSRYALVLVVFYMPRSHALVRSVCRGFTRQSLALNVLCRRRSVRSGRQLLAASLISRWSYKPESPDYRGNLKNIVITFVLFLARSPHVLCIILRLK